MPAYGLAAVLIVMAATILVGAFGIRLSRTTSDFYVASRSVSPLWNASAIGGEYLSGASFLGIAGLILAYGADMLWLPVGWTGGYLDLLVLVSVFCFAGGGLMVQRLSRGLSALEISWSVYLFGTVLLSIHALLVAPVPVATLLHGGAWLWLLIVFSAVGATAIAGVVWNKAISHLGAARTAMAFYWVPIFGVAFAALFLGEAVTWWHALGLAGVILGARLSARRAGVAEVAG